MWAVHALEHVALGPGRDADHREGFAAVDRGVRLGERLGAHRHADRAARVQGLHDAAAQIAQVVVDDRDRDLAQDLGQVGLRVVDAVDQRRHDQQDEGAADCRARAAIRPQRLRRCRARAAGGAGSGRGARRVMLPPIARRRRSASSA